MERQWYYSRGEQNQGPVPEKVLVRLARSGMLRHDDLVWTEGMQDWRAAGTMARLFPPAAGQAIRPPVLDYRQPESATGRVQYASLWLRFVAACVDGFILSIGIGVLYAASIAVTIPLRDPALMHTVVLLTLLVCILMAWLYSALMESSARQATLGKMLVHIRVTNERGGRLSFGRATERYFTKALSPCFTCFIGYLLAAFTQRRQALHDMAAKSIVINAAPVNK